MPFSVTCPGCNGINTREDALAGQQVPCQFCGAALEGEAQGPNSEQTSEKPAPTPPPKVMRPVSAPVDDLNDFPRSRPRAVFERHRREVPQTTVDESATLAFDPIKWAPVRKGLTMVIWGWAAILGVSALFVAFWLFVFFFVKPEPQEDGTLPVGGQFWAYTAYLFNNDIACIRALGLASVWSALVGGLAAFAGQCLCITVPTVSRARSLVVGSVLGTAGTIVLTCALWFMGIAVPPEPADQQPVEPKAAEPKAAMPAEEAPKAEPPPPGEEAPKVEAPAANAAMPDQAVPPPAPPLAGSAIPRLPKLLIMGAYFVSQMLFVLFLKRVALYFHDVFLADGTSAYLTLLLAHTALVAFLPLEVMIACFFWVILLALQFLLMAWLLNLVAGTRKAIG